MLEDLDMPELLQEVEVEIEPREAEGLKPLAICGRGSHDIVCKGEDKWSEAEVCMLLLLSRSAQSTSRARPACCS